MRSKAVLLSIGFPHSGHSPGVSGNPTSSSVFKTSTKGSLATTERKRSGAMLAAAPISAPPADSPMATMRPLLVMPPATRCSAAAMKSERCIALVLTHPLAVPALAFLVAAANMGEGEDEAAIDQRKPRRGKIRLQPVAIAAIAVEHQRGGAVERGSPMQEQRDRHRLAVQGRGKEPTHDVFGRIVARWDVLGLPQHPPASFHVIVEHLRGRRHRGVDEA